MRPVLLSVIVAAATAALPAGAQIYRWADERGAINYTSVPPGAGIFRSPGWKQVIPVSGLCPRRRVSAARCCPALPPPPAARTKRAARHVDRATIEALGLALAAREPMFHRPFLALREG